MGRALMIVLIFVVVGPLIGLVTLSTLLTVFAAAQLETAEAIAKEHSARDAAALGLFVMIYGVLFAHFVGALWAAVAGALVALRSQLWGPGSIFEGVPIGVLTALASLVTWDFKDINSSSLGEIEGPAMAGWILVHVVPAAVCIWLTRRWQSPQTSNT
jgi:hypothetical protein